MIYILLPIVLFFWGLGGLIWFAVEHMPHKSSWEKNTVKKKVTVIALSGPLLWFLMPTCIVAEKINNKIRKMR